MRLKRPSITPGPWTPASIPNTDDPIGFTVVFSVSEAERAPARAYGDTEEQEAANAKSIAQLPEVMDRLEWLHELLSEQGNNPMTVHELEQTMLKMGYTEVKEVEA